MNSLHQRHSSFHHGHLVVQDFLCSTTCCPMLGKILSAKYPPVIQRMIFGRAKSCTLYAEMKEHATPCKSEPFCSLEEQSAYPGAGPHTWAPALPAQTQRSMMQYWLGSRMAHFAAFTKASTIHLARTLIAQNHGDKSRTRSDEKC